MDRRGLQTGRRQDRLDAVGRRLAQGHHQDPPPRDARHPRQRQKSSNSRSSGTAERVAACNRTSSGVRLRAFGQLEQSDDRLFARQRDQDMGRPDPGTVQLGAELLACRLRVFRRDARRPSIQSGRICGRADSRRRPAHQGPATVDRPSRVRDTPTCFSIQRPRSRPAYGLAYEDRHKRVTPRCARRVPLTRQSYVMRQSSIYGFVLFSDVCATARKAKVWGSSGDAELLAAKTTPELGEVANGDNSRRIDRTVNDGLQPHKRPPLIEISDRLGAINGPTGREIGIELCH